MSFNNNRVKKTVTSDTTFVIPCGYAIAAICIENTTANAVTGGIKIGTTNGGTEVLAATLIPANHIGVVEGTLGDRYFSSTVDATIYFQAVIAWNSASLVVTICLIEV